MSYGLLSPKTIVFTKTIQTNVCFVLGQPGLYRDHSVLAHHLGLYSETVLQGNRVCVFSVREALGTALQHRADIKDTGNA